MQIGNIDITKEMMPSYIAGQDYPLRMYQAKQERLNAKLGNVGNGQPVQTQPMGNMEQQQNAWQQGNK